MTRSGLTLLLAALVALSGLAVFADEPPPDPGDAPLRLKKKKADDQKTQPAKTVPKSADDKKSDDEKKPDREKEEAKEGPVPTEPEQDDKEVMGRLARNVRSVGDRLGKGDLTEGTRQLQDDILKDIRALLRHSENPPAGGAGGAQQDQNKGEQNQDQGDGKDGGKSQDG